MKTKYYAGIGSRKTPVNILNIMEQAAFSLASQGWTLRSGHSTGADNAFEKGAGEKSELFLPWKTFGSQPVKAELVVLKPSAEAFEIATEFHPAFKSLKNSHQLLLARNVHQILGVNLDKKSSFVLCWTEQGKKVGGTGFTLRVAEAYNVEIFNLFEEEVQQRIQKMINAN